MLRPASFGLVLGPALAVGLGPACAKPTSSEEAQYAEQPVAGATASRAEEEVVSDGEVSSGEAAASAGADSLDTRPEPPWEPTEDYLRFSGACAEGPRATFAFGGDLLLHHELQTQAYAASTREGAAVIWAGIADLLAEPQLTYLNLEGPMAPGLDRDFLDVPDPGRSFDRVVYSGYPRFNYHPSIAKDLVRAGIDIVSTANNHALDRGSVGVDRTIAGLRQAKLDFVGTREAGADERWYTITEVEGMKVGWVACTNNTNQIPDDLDQVMRCGRGAGVAKVISRLRATGRYAKRAPLVDAVIVTPHWGKEYVHEPREKEQVLAQKWIDAGALAVIGSHPHVVQPWEKRVAEDGREGLVLYSLGNFASHQPELPRRSSLLLYVELVRVPAGEDDAGEVRIAGVRYLPLHVREDGGRYFVESVDRVGGPGDARALISRLLGPANLVLPDEQKRGDPHCDPAWRPHPIPEWAAQVEPAEIPAGAGTEATVEQPG
ncbi:CapA family protein [Pseudenhygromyxa sp. WMMC2535]|uniref:CapA family protein n=1 Tax=Pseudenhygromyxa sp. WMMC2535 TaxID=2712867 RepID=UPI001556A6E8|nr:CapA family protein [Pseudenhygromyxa sp. WMMC2535]NVB42369.1 CapA family protein [Pseudenhygromyxa sp. WMMC2535]